jgi:hypothetical protein
VKRGDIVVIAGKDKCVRTYTVVGVVPRPKPKKKRKRKLSK